MRSKQGGGVRVRGEECLSCRASLLVVCLHQCIYARHAKKGSTFIAIATRLYFAAILHCLQEIQEPLGAPGITGSRIDHLVSFLMFVAMQLQCDTFYWSATIILKLVQGRSRVLADARSLPLHVLFASSLFARRLREFGVVGGESCFLFLFSMY